ncbi:MAG: APC family permease, partial [Eggerthella lenta]
VLSIYLMVSVLSMGVMPLSELAQLENPALAGVMEHAVGQWGAILINGGVVLSLVGAMLGYTVLSSESPYEAAEQGVFIKAFAKTNKKGAPIVTLVVTNVIIEAFLVVMLFSDSTYQFFYALSAGMILLPYLLSAAYFAKLTFTEPDAFKGKVGGSLVLWRIFGVFGVVYSFFLAWASGATGLTLMSLLYAPGILMYIKGKKERNEPYLKSTVDKVVVAIILIAAVTSLVLLFTGQVVL